MSSCGTQVWDKKLGKWRQCKKSACCPTHVQSDDNKNKSLSTRSESSARRSPPTQGATSEIKRKPLSPPPATKSSATGRGVTSPHKRSSPAKVASQSAEFGLDALPTDVQALILAGMTADELELVTGLSLDARDILAKNERKCALAGARCSNYWRDEFERTRMAEVLTSLSYREYLATLSADERDVIRDDIRSSKPSGTSVRNALCKLGCETRAVTALEPYVARVLDEAYPVVFGVMRSWPRRGLRQITLRLTPRVGGEDGRTRNASDGKLAREYALVVGIAWDKTPGGSGDLVNPLEYEATRAYLESDAAATIADSAFSVTSDVAPWWNPAFLDRYTTSADYLTAYVGPATRRTAHKIAQVSANIVFTFGDTLTFFIDYAKRQPKTRPVVSVALDGDAVNDVLQFGTTVSRAFEQLPLTIWSDEPSILNQLRRDTDDELPANWTLAKKDPAAADYGPDDQVSRRLTT